MWGVRLKAHGNTENQGRQPHVNSNAFCHLPLILLHFHLFSCEPNPTTVGMIQLPVVPAIVKPHGEITGASHKLHRNPGCSVNRAAGAQESLGGPPSRVYKRPVGMMALMGTYNLHWPAGRNISDWKANLLIYMHKLGSSHLL